jgi:hypothetical protein
VGPGGHPRPPAGPRAEPAARAASRAGHAPAHSLPWSRTPRPPSAYLDPAAPCASSFPWNPSPRPAPPPPNPSALPPPSIFRTAALQSLRSRPVAPSHGEEATGLAHWSPRAVYRPRALTGGRRREPSAPPSRAPSPMRTRRSRHPRRVHRGPRFTLLQAACQIVFRRSNLSKLAGAPPPLAVRPQPSACLRACTAV